MTGWNSSFTVKSWQRWYLKMAGMNRKLHRTVDFLRIYQRPTKKRKSPTFQSCITVWITDYCIFVQKSRWGNIKTNSYTWKRSWKQACTVSWYQKSCMILMWSMSYSMIRLQTVSPLTRYKLKMAACVWWRMSGGSMTSSLICWLLAALVAVKLTLSSLSFKLCSVAMRLCMC